MKKIYMILILLALFSFRVADNRSVYNTPMQANAVCASDYDLDGDLDIIINHGIDPLTNWGGFYILQNDGYGNFSFLDSIYDSTGSWLLYTDTIINKVSPDIVYSLRGNLKILSRENENYSIKEFPLGPHLTFINIGDINDDGHIDVVFISNRDRYWGIIYNQGDGTFTAPEYYDVDYPPTDIECGDLNDDGRDDVVVGGGSCEIYFSTENGFEMQVLQENAFNVKIADFDIDGDMDIITYSDAYIMTFVHLYENLGNNSFDTVSNFNIDKGCSGFFIADFNNDSLPDVLFSHHEYPGGYLLYSNQGGFQFGEPDTINLCYSGEARRFMYCADMDGNGFNDIITSKQVFDISYTSSILEILFNDGQGNFIENPLSIKGESFDKKTSKLINYPNPFKTGTTFEFTINETTHIELSVFNLQGQLVKSLTNKTMKGGKHQIKWGGLNNAGQACKPGPYIAYLKVDGSFTGAIKIIIN